MSMQFILCRISETELESAISDLNVTQKLLLNSWVPAMPPEILQKIQEQLKNASPEKIAQFNKLQAFGARNINNNILNLDKEWHLLHFLFTGDSSLEIHDTNSQPQYQIILGGHRTSFDLTYGPAIYLYPTEVSKAYDALQAISDSMIRSRLTSEALPKADIYGVSNMTETETELNLRIWQVPELRNFYASAVEANQCVLKAVI